MPPPPPDEHGAVLHAVVPTTMDVIPCVRRLTEGLLACEGWSDDDAADAGLVVTELLQNAIEHGSRDDASETVACRLAALPGRAVRIEVTDPGTGRGYEALASRDVTKPPPLDAIRGRGLFLVHRMAEALSHARASGGGAVVSARLRAAGTAAS